MRAKIADDQDGALAKAGKHGGIATVGHPNLSSEALVTARPGPLWSGMVFRWFSPGVGDGVGAGVGEGVGAETGTWTRSMGGGG